MTPEEYNSIRMNAFFRTVKMAAEDSALGAVTRAAWKNKKALALLAAGGVAHEYASDALEDYRMGKQMRKMRQEG